MTIKEALSNSINTLKQSKIESPIQIAKIVLSNVLKQSKEYILINEKEILDSKMYETFMKKIEQISLGIPMQYVTNKQEFMGMEFYIDENVLVPRPDTEILVEEAISIIKNNSQKLVLDMCTGSGAIAVSIAKYTTVDKVYAVDISQNALEVAIKNAIKNKVENKIKFINSNMFENLEIGKKFDMIISNPPYIETKIIPTLSKQVQKEPYIALDGGEDGLNFYRNLAINAKKYLTNSGVLALEIGYNQRESVINLLRDKFANVCCKKDLSGNDRVIICSN